jgi:hypothetical protein
MVKAITGINQQKKTMMKQRLTSSVSIFFTSPYLTINIIPRAAIPTTTIDQPTINHLKNSDKRSPFLKAGFQMPNSNYQIKSRHCSITISISYYLTLGIALISFELYSPLVHPFVRALSFHISFPYSPLTRRLYFLISA